MDEVSDDHVGESLHPLLIRGARWRQGVDDFATSSQRLPTRGSERGEDFGRTKDYLDPAYIASGKLGAAHDATRALALLWSAGHVHHVADYALLRTIIECAGAAWWVLESPSAQSRFVRAYTIARDDLESARGRENLAVKFAQTDEGRSKRAAVVDRINQRLHQAETDMRSAGFGDEPIVQKWKRFELVEVLRDAQQRLPAPDLGFTLAWSMLSSLSHGSPTSILEFADTDPGDPALVPQRHIGTNADNVEDLAAAVDVLFRAANRQWHRYSDSVATARG